MSLHPASLRRDPESRGPFFFPNNVRFSIKETSGETMGSPQLEDGYARIANEILENLAKIRIPGEAMQMLLFIFRKTYGYHKKSDGIATSQIMDGTGMGRRGVERARNILRRMNLISTDKKDGTYYLTYSFNKHFKTWVPTVKKCGTDKNRCKVPPKTVVGVPPKTVNTKDNVTKDNIQKIDENFLNSHDGRKAFQELTRKLAREKGIS